MINFIKTIFKPLPKHQWSTWVVTSRLVSDYGLKKIQQERTCKVCGYTEIKTDTTY